MSDGFAQGEILSSLNPEQQRAVRHGDSPLLIVAGAGTGKTMTLAHRVAHLIASGTDPARILLLTFSRRAAAEMLRRVDAILARAGAEPTAARRVWGGTFHAVGARLLRVHGPAIGLPADFTIHDRGDSEDLMHLVRGELGLGRGERRFPKKGTCLDLYSRCVNARARLADVIAEAFPWCAAHEESLGRLFSAYVERKAALAVLDYDDLLLFWRGLLADAAAGEAVRRRFDRLLVDEYQDTNVLQAEIVAGLRPGGHGVTVVGDDAQAIYSFRAATVRNILDFPRQVPGTTVITLEQSYRATPPLLAAANAVIAQAQERHAKQLWTARSGDERPELVTCRDEEEQTAHVVTAVLARHEDGMPLRRQAVLFRAAHHSLDLEIELARRQIPFHKFGGLRFLEAAHVKDALAFLRLAENPRDRIAGTRVLLLLPGIGPRKAQRLIDALVAAGGALAAWSTGEAPTADASWRAFVELMRALAGPAAGDSSTQLGRVRSFYTPFLEARYDHAPARLRDLEQMERVATRFPARRTFLTALALDPPSSTQDLAGAAHLDDDYLVLSTIHSAKGLEWDAVTLIHASDGNIPSDLCTGRAELVEEELRLLYVAMTRARTSLAICAPQRYYRAGSLGDVHSYAQPSRFLVGPARACFAERAAATGKAPAEPEPAPAGPSLTSEEVRKALKGLWS